MSTPETAALVAEGHQLEQEIAIRQERLKFIKGDLIKSGPGEYFDGAGHKALVIAPGPKIAPAKTAIPEVKSFLTPLAFKKLFEFTPVYKPAKDFRAVAGAILTPAKFTKLIVLCEVEQTPYVVFK